MTANELVLLDAVIDQQQADRPVPLPDDVAFERFACQQVLRDFDLSPDEIEAGIVGGGDDGGIDGVYTFLGDALITEDDEIFGDEFVPARIAVGVPLSLHLVQAKRSESFAETAVDLVSSSAGRLLDLSQSDEDLRKLYSEAVVSRISLFRLALRQLATRHPFVRIEFAYATRGSTANINPKVHAKAEDLKQQFAALLTDAKGTVVFLGAAELWQRSSALPTYTLELTYQENATSGTSHVALVSLRDYLNFISDDRDVIMRHIFDWNVRDYQGGVEVNKEIEKSLLDPSAPEFWWLNNGVTVICSKASVVSKTYILDDVQIVNGLQTSHTIYNSLKGAADSPALDRNVLVRILVTEDQQSRDKVIRATNRQTSVPEASLRATDEIQRSIEKYFQDNGWYYDRRKNYYRNLGKSADRIISIPFLAQVMMAVGLGRPDDSRARPSSLLKRDADYQTIFKNDIDLAIFLWAVKTQKGIDAYLLTDDAGSNAQERTNLRFHLAMLVANAVAGNRIYAPSQLADVATRNEPIDQKLIGDNLILLRSLFEKYRKDTNDAPDKIAKGSGFVAYVLAETKTSS